VRILDPPPLVLTALLVLPAAAQENPQGESPDLIDLSLEELMNIDVEVTSVSRKSESLARSAAAVYVITAEDIRRSGATSIPEALRMAPGLQVSRLSASAYSITARGFGGEFANKLLVLIDGRTVYTPLFSGTFWQNQDLLLEDIARIEVIRGPGAAMWGANAVNGVINIITKPAVDTQGTLTSVLVGSEEKFTGQVRTGGPLGEKGHLRTWAKFVDRDGLDYPGDDVDSGFEASRGGFRADWELDCGQSLTLKGDVYTNRGARAVQFPDPLAPPEPTIDLGRRDDGGNLLLRWEEVAEDGTATHLQTYYARTEFQSNVVDEDRDTFDVDFQRRQWLGERHELVWGFGYRHSDSETVGSTTIFFDPASRTTDLFSGFIQDEYTWNENTRLTAGAKVEHNDYTDFEFQPNLRLLWSPSEQHTVWGAVSRAVRTPARVYADVIFQQDLLPDTPPGFDTIVTLKGDEDFESEELLAWELGYRVRPDERLSVDISVFLNDYDKLYSLEFGDVNVIGAGLLEQELVADNLLEGTATGLELAAQYNPSDRWQLHASYTFTELDVDARSGSTDPQPEDAELRVPQNQAQLRSYYDLSETTELDVALYYVDHLSLGVDSYVRGDVRLGWKPCDSTTVTVGVQGIGHDEDLEFPSGEFGDYYLVETSAFVKVSIRF